MRPRINLTVLASVAALGLSAHPVAAQQASALSSRSRILATYDFRTPRGAVAFPSMVSVADSAGRLVATAAIAGDHTTIPMTVTVMETDLVLQAETPDGRLLTLVLDRQNQGDAGQLLTGRWALGDEEGKLRGRVR